MRKLALDDDILLNIEKPARYIGHEGQKSGRYSVRYVFSGGI